MKTKMFQVAKVQGQKLALAVARAEFDHKVMGILNHRGMSRKVKRQKLQAMLIELVNSGNSFETHKHTVLMAALKKI